MTSLNAFTLCQERLSGSQRDCLADIHAVLLFALLETAHICACFLAGQGAVALVVLRTKSASNDAANFTLYCLRVCPFPKQVKARWPGGDLEAVAQVYASARPSLLLVHITKLQVSFRLALSVLVIVEAALQTKEFAALLCLNKR